MKDDRIKLKVTITLKQAREIALKAGIKVSIPTLISWVIQMNLGFQPAGKTGKWYVYKEDYLKFISGESHGENNSAACKTSCKQKSKSCPERSCS